MSKQPSVPHGAGHLLEIRPRGGAAQCELRLAVAGLCSEGTLNASAALEDHAAKGGRGILVRVKPCSSGVADFFIGELRREEALDDERRHVEGTFCPHCVEPVSYTHLTLPTICSV